MCDAIFGFFDISLSMLTESAKTESVLQSPNRAILSTERAAGLLDPPQGQCDPPGKEKSPELITNIG